MAGKNQGHIQGTPYTRGSCDDPNYPGHEYFSLGSKHDHTTFIVDPNGNLAGMSARGGDKAMWDFLGQASLRGPWD